MIGQVDRAKTARRLFAGSRQFWHLNFVLRAIVPRAFCPLNNFYISVNFRYCPHNNLPSQQFLDLAFYYTHLPVVFCPEGKLSSGHFALSTIFYISVNFISGHGRSRAMDGGHQRTRAQRTVEIITRVSKSNH